MLKVCCSQWMNCFKIIKKKKDHIEKNKYVINTVILSSGSHLQYSQINRCSLEFTENKILADVTFLQNSKGSHYQWYDICI